MSNIIIQIFGGSLVEWSPYSHGELVSRADPDEVKVGKGPRQAKGEAPAHHDAKVGEQDDCHNSQDYCTHLGWGKELFPSR